MRNRFQMHYLGLMGTYEVLLLRMAALARRRSLARGIKPPVFSRFSFQPASAGVNSTGFYLVAVNPFIL